MKWVSRIAWLFGAAWCVVGTALAQERARGENEELTLAKHLQVLADQRLLAAETGSVERMRELVRRGEELYFESRFDESALFLFEVVESPKFADFVDNDEFRGAEYMLAGALEKLGALKTSMRYLERIIQRGTGDAYFGPAYRRYVDVTLELGNPEWAVKRLEEMGGTTLPPDAQNEIRYLRAKQSYEARDWAEAETRFAQITRRSRFFANAQYFRGTIAAKSRKYREAEKFFCSIASTPDQNRFTFYVDERYFEIKDLTWLALGRVAHEQNRSEDAFYYYFQVPADADRVAEALFEAAYSMYEGGDYETSVDLLDQLEARFPASTYVDEAALLRGYVHLSRCEFDDASQLFSKFIQKFGPMVEEVHRVMENPARQAGLYEDLLSEQQAALRDGRTQNAAALSVKSMMLSMLVADSTFFRLHADVRALDAEAARAARLETDIEALRARLHGEDRPQAAAPVATELDEAEGLKSDLDVAQSTLDALLDQLDVLRRAGAPKAKIAEIERDLRPIARRVAAIKRQLRRVVPKEAEALTQGSSGPLQRVDELLAKEHQFAAQMPRRVARVREALMEGANAEALRVLQGLSQRISQGLRRARIGKIDAVMGSKRRVELQVQSLAAGRFPPELQDPLRTQGLLREDEEYWPFEGERWKDEFRETEED